MRNVFSFPRQGSGSLLGVPLSSSVRFWSINWALCSLRTTFSPYRILAFRERQATNAKSSQTESQLSRGQQACAELTLTYNTAFFGAVLWQASKQSASWLSNMLNFPECATASRHSSNPPPLLPAGTFIITRRRMTRVVTLRSSSELEPLPLELKSW